MSIRLTTVKDWKEFPSYSENTVLLYKTVREAQEPCGITSLEAWKHHSKCPFCLGKSTKTLKLLLSQWGVPKQFAVSMCPQSFRTFNPAHHLWIEFLQELDAPIDVTVNYAGYDLNLGEAVWNSLPKMMTCDSCEHPAQFEFTHPKQTFKCLKCFFASPEFRLEIEMFKKGKLKLEAQQFMSVVARIHPELFREEKPHKAPTSYLPERFAHLKSPEEWMKEEILKKSSSWRVPVEDVLKGMLVSFEGNRVVQATKEKIEEAMIRLGLKKDV